MSPISIRCCSHTQVSNIKHYQIKKPPSRCQYNVPMQIPMQISNANFLCNSLFAISNAIVNANFQCKFLMQFPMQISNANFQCKFHLQFSLHFSMQSPLHTCLQNKYTGAARQRRGKSFASSRPARCIGGVLPSTARPPLAQLQDAPVQFQTAPIQCCPGMSSAIQYCPDQGGLCCNPSPICQQGQGTHLHQQPSSEARSTAAGRPSSPPS